MPVRQFLPSKLSLLHPFLRPSRWLLQTAQAGLSRPLPPVESSRWGAAAGCSRGSYKRGAERTRHLRPPAPPSHVIRGALGKLPPAGLLSAPVARTGFCEHTGAWGARGSFPGVGLPYSPARACGDRLVIRLPSVHQGVPPASCAGPDWHSARRVPEGSVAQRRPPVTVTVPAGPTPRGSLGEPPVPISGQRQGTIPLAALPYGPLASDWFREGARPEARGGSVPGLF